MKKRILIIDSSEKSSEFFVDLLEGLKAKGYVLSFLSSSSSGYLYDRICQGNDAPQRRLRGIFEIKNNISCLFKLLAYPLLAIYFFFVLSKIKKKEGIDAALLLNFNEKVLLTRLLQLLKIKTYWVERPDNDYSCLKGLYHYWYKLAGRKAVIISFSPLTKVVLENVGIKNISLHYVLPGIRMNRHLHQEDIFNDLAQKEHSGYHKKFFTIGTVLDLDEKHRIEMLFQAAKTCLTVIPNLQLEIVGDGKDRKELIWLAKKMGIDNLVWLVGEQKHLKKWLDGFDIYVAAFERPGLDDVKNLLKAMASALPVVCPVKVGLDELVLENKNGALIEMDNCELLSRQIINLYKNKRLREELGQNAKTCVDKYFNFDKMLASFEHAINSQGEQGEQK